MSWQIRCCGVKIDTSLSQYHGFEMDLAFNYSTWMVNFRPKGTGPLFPFFMFSNFYNTKNVFMAFDASLHWLNNVAGENVRANQKKSRNHLLANPPTCCCKYVYIVLDSQSCCLA
jgi:hypothetical protein